MTSSNSQITRSKYKRPRKQPNKKLRPSPAAFRAGSSKLDLINSMAPKRRVIYINLSSDSDEPDTLPEIGPAQRPGKQPQPATDAHDHYTPMRVRQRQRPVVIDSDDEERLLASRSMSWAHRAQGSIAISNRENPSKQSGERRPKCTTSIDEDGEWDGAGESEEDSEEDSNEDSGEDSNEDSDNDTDHANHLSDDTLDLDIDMGGWQKFAQRNSQSQHQARTSSEKEKTLRYRTRHQHQRSTNPSTTVQSPRQRTLSGTAQSPRTTCSAKYAATSANSADIRPSTANSLTADNAEVKAGIFPRFVKEVRIPARFPAQYDKQHDPTYDPVRDAEHEVHHNSDTPLLGVEQRVERQLRLQERLRRLY